MAKIANITSTTNGFLFKFGSHGELSVDIEQLSPEIVQQLALHGLKQKLGDSYATNEGQKDAMEKATDAWAMLKEGQWSRGRESASGDLVEALHRFTGKPTEECAKVIAGLGKEGKAELKKHAGIAAALAAIKAERAAAKAGSAPTGMDIGELFPA